MHVKKHRDMLKEIQMHGPMYRAGKYNSKMQLMYRYL